MDLASQLRWMSPEMARYVALKEVVHAYFSRFRIDKTHMESCYLKHVIMLLVAKYTC